MVPGAQGDTHEVGSRYLNFRHDTYLDTKNVKYTLSCPRPGKIVANGVCHCMGIPTWDRKSLQTLFEKVLD